MRMTKAFNQHVIDQLTRYINDTRANVHQYDKSIHGMILQDANYAKVALNEFKANPDWKTLREKLIEQDTLPREECFYYLVEQDKKTAQKVGITWEFVNTQF